MRVCLFTETFHPVVGGGETQARLLAESLASEGIDTFILTRRSDPGLAGTEELGSLPVVRLGPSGAGQLKKWGLVLTGVPALIRRRRDYDTLLLNGFRITGISAVPAAKALGKRVVLKADSQGEMSGEFFTAGLARFGVTPESVLFRIFLRFRNAILRRADAFIAITEEVAAEFEGAGIPAEAICRIPNAVDTDRFSPRGSAEKRVLRERLGLPATGAIFTYTGRLVTYKGLPLLVDVWARVRDRHPGAMLLLVGVGGLDIHACEDELRGTVEDRGLRGSVRFTGSVENVHEYLGASDAFVFPTENDAFPSSLVEAMASGLPVITTPVGAIPEIVSHELNGLLVPSGDGPALEGAIERVLSDRDLSTSLGTQARAAVEERYSVTTVTARYLDVMGVDRGRIPPEVREPGA
jgi:glycosyltransferase involved in cell wall biosynthesis